MTAVETLGLHFGPSDQDRDAWLAARRLGVTATEVRDLYTGKIAQADLIARKLGRTPEVADLSYVPEIKWGRDREVVIAETIRERYAIEHETRLILASDNPRFLYSPDGIGVDFDGDLVLSEIKTDGKEIPIGSEKFEEHGYRCQMTWGMRVTGARRFLYAWEQRLGSRREGFRPGTLHFDWFEYDEGLAAELERIATEFLAALDAAAAEPFVEPVIDEAVDTHAVNYLRGLDMEKQGKALKESEYRALLEAGVSQESPLARVTFTPAKPAAVLDVEEVDFEAARATPEGAALFEAFNAAGDAWQEYAEKFKVTRRIEGKPTAARVTVTAGKGTKQ